MRKLYVLALFLATFQLAGAQLKAEKALLELDAKYAQEKIHIFLNKDAYVSGETVWLKPYIFSGSVLSLISTNLYLELYNDQKQLVDRQILPIIQGTGEGSIALAEKLPEGIYHLRAYTKWMLNFDSAFHYFQSFPVYNQASPNRIGKKPVQWTAAAYAESNVVLAGEENKIAIRLQSAGSYPASWEGYVVDKKDPATRLANFSSFNPQIGSFLFYPEAGKEYQAHITDHEGKTAIVPLPPVQTAGVALRAEQTGEQVYVDMMFKGLPNGGMNHKILAHIQNEVVFSAIIRKSDALVKAAIPVKNLGTGIMHLTLFDENERPVAERLVFVDNHTVARPKISTDIISAERRGVNHWKLAVDTMQFQTYAVSIVDGGLSSMRNRNILSDLWLGDLSRDIYQPGWYFSSTDPARQLALDALMVTERWKRFDWSPVLAGNFPKIIFQPERYLSFFAMATRFRRIVPNETLNLIMRYKDSSVQLTQVKTDNLGSFHIVNAAFYDTVKVYFQSNSRKGAAKDVDVVFESNNIFRPLHGALPVTEYQLVKRKADDPLPPIVQNALDAKKMLQNIDDRYQEMETVRVEAKKKTETQKLNEELSSTLFSPGNEIIFDFLNEEHGTQAYSNIFEFLEGRVPGLNFSMTDGVRIPIMRDGQVGVFIDEIQSDYDMIQSLPMNQIAMVKIIRGYFLGGMSGGGGAGAIAVYTTRAGLGGKFGPSGMPSAYLVGYRQTAPFRHFNHADEIYRLAKTDTRDNLYWSVSLFPDQAGWAPVRFFNNDVSGSYRVIVTGFTRDAKPVYEEKIIQIR